MADGAKVRTVSDLMTPDVLTATPSETIAEVSTRMGERKVGSIVVLDDTRPVGILTERDMIKIAASGTDTAIAKVSEWMTEQICRALWRSSLASMSRLGLKSWAYATSDTAVR
ncbi:MAG: CBS domain-containing protein, partial [Acidimicrobiia bacterium]|nr:CBS domain-containing protein [Acidimicrobiia bacterium]